MPDSGGDAHGDGEGTRFVVELGSFEGPLDLLLDLARAQKIDLGRISILALAEQYLCYLERVRAAELPVAADYLVMAAWLAYLKSQLLLPTPERDDAEPEALLARLEERLADLAAVRRAADWLEGRPRLGRDRLARAGAEVIDAPSRTEWRATLADLISAWRTVTSRTQPPTLTFPARRLCTLEAALERLGALVAGQGWRDLRQFLPAAAGGGLAHRSALAASLMAGLELARRGEIELAQPAPFGPVLVRRPT